MTGDENGNAGFSLVAVLVFMLVVSAVVVPFAVTAKTRLLIANNEVEQERLSLLAEGLANVVSTELASGSFMESLPLNSKPTGCQAGDFVFDVKVQDHSGLIDLNAADARLLSLGFASLGFDRQTSDELAKAALRFRASASAFATQSEPPASQVGPRENKLAPFESVSELQEFPALASIPLHDLYDVFTVNWKRGALILDKAPDRLRTALVDGSGTGLPVMQTSASPSVYTVEVTARRSGSGIVGQAGFVIEALPASAAGFHRLSRSPALDFTRPMRSSKSIGCEVLFRAEAAEALRSWAS